MQVGKKYMNHREETIKWSVRTIQKARIHLRRLHAYSQYDKTLIEHETNDLKIYGAIFFFFTYTINFGCALIHQYHNTFTSVI